MLQPVAKREQRSAISCFPVSLCHSRGLGSGQACQDLMTVGTRMWGSWWDGRALLRVRIYDFAVYMDREQVRNAASPAGQLQLHVLMHCGVSGQLQTAQALVCA